MRSHQGISTASTVNGDPSTYKTLRPLDSSKWGLRSRLVGTCHGSNLEVEAALEPCANATATHDTCIARTRLATDLPECKLSALLRIYYPFLLLAYDCQVP